MATFCALLFTANVQSMTNMSMNTFFIYQVFIFSVIKILVDIKIL